MRALASLAVCLLLFCSLAFAQFSGGFEPTKPPPPPREILLTATDEISQIIPQKSPEGTSDSQKEKGFFARLLTQKTSVHFDNLPLDEAIKQLSQQTEIDIRIDQFALEEFGLKPSVKVSLQLEDVSLYSVLKWLLHPNDLTFIIDAESIVITNVEKAENNLKVTFYAIPELIGNPAFYDEVIETMTTVIEPDSWEELGGPGSVAPYNNGIMVTNTNEIHVLIDQMLTGLKHFQTFPNNPYPTASYPLGLFPQRQSEILAHLHQAEALSPEAPLTWENLLKQLRQQARCPIHIDQRGLEDIGFQTEGMLIPQLPKGCSLARTLDIVTEANELGWFVAGDLVVISNQEEEKSHLDIALYPVRDLVWKGMHITNPQLQNRLLANDSFLVDPWAEDAIALLPDYDAIIEMLTTTINPSSWEDLGGPGGLAPFTLHADCLAISQTQANHQAVRLALSQIREQQQPVDIEKMLANIAKHESELLIRSYSVMRKSAENPLFTPNDLKQIAELIQEQVEPESWRQELTYIRPLGDTIVVRNRRDVQRQVQEYLREMSVTPPPQAVGYSGCMMSPSSSRYLPPQQSTPSSPQPTPAVPQANAQGGGGVF
ncbi:hypothetical protein DTL42_23010 [Bremerella cremea]|uniref:Uncharacterized protein n=1 Tax=Bremerella cremea TaxID=1031537 RepID=A0A368KPJ2_9BACT|nr:hypothetical protein [Bremerella cremea]RCS41430.1 hypothetical protein DTL42_23010 [Bremerella cremea]